MHYKPPFTLVAASSPCEGLFKYSEAIVNGVMDFAMLSFSGSKFLLIAALVLGIGWAPKAADMPATSYVSTAPAGDALPKPSLDDYAKLYANLLLVRAHFGVIFAEDVLGLLKDELATFSTTGMTADAMNKLQRKFQGEADHFIVELQYVIEADGAVWPQEKSERTYKLDSLATLMRIRQDLDALLAANEDPLELLQELASINQLTEGELPSETIAFSVAYRNSLTSAALP